MPTSAKESSRRPAYRLIAEGLRGQIVRGDYRPGTQLPSTDELALLWRSTNFTVHGALTTLVKEGWVERINGRGTFVVERANLFRCAGIYHGTDIWADESRQFTRNVHQALVRQLREKGRTTENFTDPRLPSQTTEMLPALGEAIDHRRIDCLIAVTIDGSMLHVFDKLKVPTACVATSVTPHRVSFDDADLIGSSVRELAGQGCRTVGIITTVSPDPPPRKNAFKMAFRRAVRDAGLKTREEWILQPHEPMYDCQPYGYTRFLKLWDLPEKPDGLLVYTDLAVRGVIPAVLKSGPAAWENMKFVFHRNLHSQMLCPFPASWLIADEDLIAQALIEMVERQFAGEAVSPVAVPHSIRREEMVLR